MSTPAISVVMPVYNAGPYLTPCIRSLLDQTFADFELVVLNDASTDGSERALRDWAERDRRIRLFESATTLGPARSSDLVVSKATAPLIARMDADDVSHPDRLRRQHEVMRTHADVALVGTLHDGIDAAGRQVRPRDRWALLRPSTSHPFAHGSVMFRRRAFDDVGGYRDACTGWEDLDLILRIGTRGRILVLPDVLYHYRYHLRCTRLGMPLSHTERTTELVDRCLVEHRRGHDYTPLLDAASWNGAGRDTAARALHLRGSLRLWAGYSPDTLRAMLSHPSFAWNRTTAPIVASAVWGTISPATLRLALRWWIRARDWSASRRVEDGRPYEWRFERPW